MAKQLLVIFLLMTCLWPGFTSAIALDVPCRGYSFHNLNDCLMDELPAFGGMELIDCKLIVYATDLSQETTIRPILEELTRDSKELKVGCGRRPPELVFQQGDYEYKALRRWFERLYYPVYRRAPGASVNLPARNRIIAEVKSQSALRRLERVLESEGVPRAAVSIGLPGASVVAPSIVFINSSPRVAVPAVEIDGTKTGDLVLGHTTMSQALRLAKAAFGHGPHKPHGGGHPPWETPLLARTFDDIRYVYNPLLMPDYILGFDRAKRLRLVQYLVPAAHSEDINRAIKSISNLTEVYRDSDIRVELGELAACVNVALVSGFVMEEPLTSMGFGFPDDLKPCLRQLDNGDTDGAIGCFKEAVEYEPDMPLAQYFLGIAFLRSGNEPATRQQIEILRRIYPANAVELLKEMAKTRPSWLHGSLAEEQNTITQAPESNLTLVLYFYTCESK